MAESSAKPVLTSRDIALRCGVSQSTVSRVLSGHPNVSAKTREAVTEVLRQTGFVPNASAQAMRTHRTRSIGVVVGTPVNLYGTEVMSQVHEHAARHGLRLSVWLADADGYSPDALQALRERSVDGLIYTTAVDPMPSLEVEINAGAPIVLMSRIIRGAATDTVAGSTCRVAGVWRNISCTTDVGRSPSSVGMPSAPGVRSSKGSARAWKAWALRSTSTRSFMATSRTSSA